MKRSPEQIELLQLLKSLLSEGLRPTQIDLLVRHAVSLSVTYIQWLTRRKGYQLQQLGMTYEDLAYDVVAEMFSGEDEYCCTALRQSLRAGEALEDADELLATFHAMLFKNVQQRMGRVFAEINPLYKYLHNALRSYVRRRSDILHLDMIDGRWLCYRNVGYARLDLPAIPLRELRYVIRPTLRYGESMAVSVLNAVFIVLDGQDSYRRAVLEEDVLRMARDLVGSELEHARIPEDETGTHVDSGNLSRVIDAAIDESRPWVEHKYVRLGRLTEREADLFFEAIRLYFKDFMQQGETDGPFHYLRSCMPGLTHERFRASYRHKYEYIFNRILERAREKLDGQFDPIRITE